MSDQSGTGPNGERNNGQGTPSNLLPNQQQPNQQANAGGNNWQEDWNKTEKWSAEDDWSANAPRPPEDPFDRGWYFETESAAPGSSKTQNGETNPYGSQSQQSAPGQQTAPGPNQRSTEGRNSATPQYRIPEQDSRVIGKQSGKERRNTAAIVETDDDLYDEAFPAPRRGRGFIAFLIVMGLFAGAALYGANWYRNEVTPSGGPGEVAEVVIPSNTSTADIGQILHAQGVVGNAKLFRFYAQFKGKGGFEAGKYSFRKNSSFDDALKILTLGAQVPETSKLTIPEGFRIEQIGERIQEKVPNRTSQGFIDVVLSGKIRSVYQPSDQTNLEGFLFPDTYTVGLDDDEATLATRMVETFDQVADEVKLGDSMGKVGIKPYEALIVASLIEEEAKLDSDRAKISRVIYNRLKTGVALQIDATIIYGLGGGITRVLNEDLKKDGPFNSYTRKGLPPSPITNPGKESMEAALNPEVGNWLYYVVTTPDGAHSFATTYKQHLANIKLAKANGVR
jgi:UPF0755 protein